MMTARRKPRVWLCYAILFVVGPPLIAACGNSSSGPSSTTPASQSASRNSAASHANGQIHSSLVGRDVVSTGTTIRRPVRGTGGSAINDDNPGRADSGTGKATGPNPCTLVSKAEAQAIVDTPIATPQEAPLGPTCIYGRRGGGDLITLAVESSDFAKIRPQIRNLRRVAVRGHMAYCGNYGRSTTFVPLAHGRVLNVAAPCAVGTRLADKALSHIES
jgi:hypothetical protein